MIGLLSKNKRAHRLFDTMSSLGSHFAYLGTARPNVVARLAARVSSLHLDLNLTRIDAQFSPFQCNGLKRECERSLMRAAGITAVLYWGAMNQPTRCLPYFIISDGPFDPDDSSYPDEWVPKRWASNYLSRQRRVYGEAAHVFTLSEWAAEKIINVHGIQREHITAVGWGPMHSSSGPTLSPPDGNYFVSIGSEWKRKGMDILATAGALLHKSNPEWSVVLAGEPRGLQIKQLPGVTLIPQEIPGEQAQHLISNARALLVGSRFDASPHVIMEAFQAGTPVIASRVCGIPEVVTPGMGYLVEVGNAEGFASAMRLCIHEDQFAQRTRVYQQYTEVLGGWESVARRIVSKLHEVIGLPDIYPSLAIQRG